MTRILLLAGTGEAREIAGILSSLPQIDVIASLAGATERPRPLPCKTRIGGFGGADGLGSFLSEQGIELLVDATHPYASQMQANAGAAATALGIPRLRLLRPAWPERASWQMVPNIATAAQALPRGARALLTTGRKEIAPFAERTDCSFVLRTIDPVADLPSHIQPLSSRLPFSAESERALFALLAVSHIVTKNAGGSGTAKLDVAAEMGLRTLVIERPSPPPGPTVETVRHAVAWIRQRVAI